MMTRRSLFITATVLLLPQRAFADQQRQLHPGDLGYKHELYHPYYQQVFSPHCSCGVGDCRVTDWRLSELGSVHGYDVIVDRAWYPLPNDVYIPPPQLVPSALRQERAHICAYRLLDTSIPCAIINVTES